MKTKIRQLGFILGAASLFLGGHEFANEQYLQCSLSLLLAILILQPSFKRLSDETL